jgi:hypothetical protein
MEANAFGCRLRIKARAASTATTSAAGTITDTFCWSPMARAVVTENTDTPTAKRPHHRTWTIRRGNPARRDLLSLSCI